jgi:hypothetical protein
LQSSQSNASSRNYPADTAKQRFIEDIYNKETMKRLSWYFATRQASNGSELPGSASRQKEMCRKRIEAACPRPTSSLMRLRERYQPEADHRRRVLRLDALPVLGDAASTRATADNIEPDMIPVDPTTKSKLYAGLSHDGKGRVDYLRTRYVIMFCVRLHAIVSADTLLNSLFERLWHIHFECPSEGITYDD